MAIITLLEEVSTEEEMLDAKERNRKPTRRALKLPFPTWRPSSPASLIPTTTPNPQPRMGEAVDKAAGVAASKKAGKAAVILEELKGEVAARTVSICTLLEEVFLLDEALSADIKLKQKRGNFSARRFMTWMRPRAGSDESIRRVNSPEPPRQSAVVFSVEERASRRPAPPQTSFHEL